MKHGAKVDEILATGTLDRLVRERADPRTSALASLVTVSEAKRRREEKNGRAAASAPPCPSPMAAPAPPPPLPINRAGCGPTVIGALRPPPLLLRCTGSGRRGRVSWRTSWVWTAWRSCAARPQRGGCSSAARSSWGCAITPTLRSASPGWR
jgi:hypothetical protein